MSKTSVLLSIGLLLILGVLSFSLLIATTVDGQDEAKHGRVALTVTRFDTKELKVTVSLDMSIYFKEEQGEWFLMHLVHVEQNRLEEVCDVNLTRKTGSEKNYIGTGELVLELEPTNSYPYDTYNITVVLYNGEIFNRTKIDSPHLEVNLSEQIRSSWSEFYRKAEITTDNTLFSDSKEIVCFSIWINRQLSQFLLLLLPILFSLTILYLTTFLGINQKDWLSNRVKVYVSLFVFAFTFQNVILSNAPLRSGVSTGELLIYVVAIDTIILFLTSVIKSYSSKEGPDFVLRMKNDFLKSFLTFDVIGLFVVVMIDLVILPFSLFFVLYVVPIPILISILVTQMRMKKFKDSNYLFDYVTIAISEGLVSNIKQGINYLVDIVKKEIHNYEKEMPELDSIITFLSDLLIANVNTSYIRDIILEGFKNLFVAGAKNKSAITYTITAQLRMLSEQTTRRDNALASRKLMLSAHELLATSLREKYEASVIEDAGITYQVISRDIIKQNIFSLFSYNTMLIGLLVLKTAEKEELERMSLELLDLIEEYVAKGNELGDPSIIHAIRHYAQMYLDKIMPNIKEREALLTRATELSKKIGSK